MINKNLSNGKYRYVIRTVVTTLKTNESNLCDKIANLLQENKETAS